MARGRRSTNASRNDARSLAVTCQKLSAREIEGEKPGCLREALVLGKVVRSDAPWDALREFKQRAARILAAPRANLSSASCENQKYDALLERECVRRTSLPVSQICAWVSNCLTSSPTLISHF